VLQLQSVDLDRLTKRLASYNLRLEKLAAEQEIPGSYWGGSEAGLIAATLYARPDTPVHSILHEASHFICATPERRATLLRDAGSDDAEECAVCYLQIVLADELPDVGRATLMSDMDDWGYSFRFGSTREWFERDAADALAWLRANKIVDADGRVTGISRC
jgi:hypothetical protein